MSESVVHAVGNPHALGQKPRTFNRQASAEAFKCQSAACLCSRRGPIQICNAVPSLSLLCNLHAVWHPFKPPQAYDGSVYPLHEHTCR